MPDRSEVVTRLKVIHQGRYEYDDTAIRAMGNFDPTSLILVWCGTHQSRSSVPLGKHLEGKTACEGCLSQKVSDSKLITASEVIAQFIARHGIDRYGYSKVVYQGDNKPVIIECLSDPSHPDFPQTPSNHKRGIGCPPCGKLKASARRVKPWADWRKRFQDAHGDRYDYTEAEKAYVNSKTDLPILCRERDHGLFYQLPENHARGNNCPVCMGRKPLPRETILEILAERHPPGRYDYTDTIFGTASEKFTAYCNGHNGTFTALLHPHLYRGVGCGECSKTKRLTTEQVIERFIKVHGSEKYGYSKVVYRGNDKDVIIDCLRNPSHGSFPQRPRSHWRGDECPKCAYEAKGLARRVPWETVLERFRKMHKDRYDYTEAEKVYQDVLSDIPILCRKSGHGVFHASPVNHYNAGSGCPICKERKGEKSVRAWLTRHGVPFQAQAPVTPGTSARKRYLTVDFLLRDMNIAIEYDGIQHTEPTSFGMKCPDKIKKEFEEGQQRDRIKNDWAERNAYTLIRIPFHPDTKRSVNKLQRYVDAYLDEHLLPLILQGIRAASVKPESMLRSMPGCDSPFIEVDAVSGTGSAQARDVNTMD